MANDNDVPQSDQPTPDRKPPKTGDVAGPDEFTRIEDDLASAASAEATAPAPPPSRPPRDLTVTTIRELEELEASVDDAEPVSADEDVNESVGKLMVDRGMLTNAQLEVAQDFRKKTGQPIWKSIMQLKLAMPSELLDFLNTPLQIFSPRPDNGFCRWILAHNLMTPEELDEAWKTAKAHKVDFIAHLRNTGLVDEDNIARALASELGVPYESLDNVVDIQPRLMRMIPPSILQRHQALPYRIDQDVLYVAFGEAHHARELIRLGIMLKVRVQPVLAPKSKLEELLEKHLPNEEFKLAVGREENLDKIESSGKVMPAVELMTVVLRGLIRGGGTDCHIEPQKDSYRVRYRVDGIMHEVMTLDSVTGKRIVTRMKSLSGMDVTQPFLPHDGHIALDIDDNEVNFRLATVPMLFGEKLAVRVVRSEMGFSSFDHLGMNLQQRKTLRNILASPTGLIVTTGPVGSGKTTTLYGALNVLDCFERNIMTIEDPVEYEVTGVTQVPVVEKRGMHFSNGLRAMLRQDPDIIMVGEIRDEETAAIAVRAAMSGTLVLSTMHANSAPTAITSLIHLGVRPYLVANAITAVIFQRLVRKVCVHCADTYDATANELQELGLPLDEKLTLLKGRGCEKCFQTGYHGRTGAFEMLEVNEEFRDVIIDNPTHDRLRTAAENSGMMPLRSHLLELVRGGVTTVEEFARVL